jgi:hypothetical protein
LALHGADGEHLIMIIKRFHLPAFHAFLALRVLVGVLTAVALHALAGCGAVRDLDCDVHDFGGGEGLHLPGFGVVRECMIPENNPLGWLELCNDGDVSADDLGTELGTTCVSTPRHLGVCIWGCGSATCHSNAYDGCYCGQTITPTQPTTPSEYDGEEFGTASCNDL